MSLSSPDARRSWAVQALVIASTAAVAMTVSAALAWTLRGWHERRESPGDGRSARDSGATDRRAPVGNAGRLAYQVHCARCHGAEGHGDGSDAERLQPPPRDFATLGGWRSGPSPETVHHAIVAGIAGTAMPGFGDSLSRRELDGLVAHVLALAPTLTTRLERAGAGFVAETSPRAAPPMLIRDLDGHPASLAERRGRPVLVLFWGTTCSHCLDEISAIFQFADRHRDEGFDLDVLPVCVDETDATVVRDVVGPELARRPLYLDPEGSARLRFDVQTLPALVLIDRSGRLIARAQGVRDWSDPSAVDPRMMKRWMWK